MGRVREGLRGGKEGRIPPSQFDIPGKNRSRIPHLTTIELSVILLAFYIGLVHNTQHAKRTLVSWLHRQALYPQQVFLLSVIW